MLVIINGLTTLGDRAYLQGRYAVINEESEVVGQDDSITSADPIDINDTPSDMQGKFLTTCRNDYGDVQIPAVVVTNNV